jgi:two-component system cell cycle response regulator CpdR
MARILIAEDDRLTREAVSRALSHGGHDVTAVADSYAALERLAAAPFDLLLSDIAMPGIDGIELALMAAKSWPETVVVLMTGYAEERERVERTGLSEAAVLAKPAALTDIVAAVESMLTRGAPKAP